MIRICKYGSVCFLNSQGQILYSTVQFILSGLSDDSISPKIVISIRKCLVVLTYLIIKCLISHFKWPFCKWIHLISLLSFLFVCQTARSHLTYCARCAVTFAIYSRHVFDGRVDISHVSIASSFNFTVIVLAHILKVFFVWHISDILL